MSNRRLVHTYTLQAEFSGEGVLVADPYPLYPRAFLWAHLDDGIMETVVTNWGNDGLYMEGVGPSLVGRVIPGLGPLQQINLGGALYFDGNGNLSYDPTALQAEIALLQGQVTALQAQVQADETNYNAQLTTLQQQVATLNAQVQNLYATIKPSAINPYGQANLAGAGVLAAALNLPVQLTMPTLSASGSLRAVVGFQLPTSASVFLGTSGISAAVLGALSIKSIMVGVGSGVANLTQTPSSLKPMGAQFLAGAGGSAFRLGVGLAVSTALTGFGNLSIGMPVALRGLSTLAGVGISTARLTQTQLYSATLAGVSTVQADLAQRSYYLSANLIGSSGLNVSPSQWRVIGQSALIGTGGLAATNLQKLLGSKILVGAGTQTVSSVGFTIVSPPYSAWDPANSDAADITFSNSNRTVINSGVSPSNCSSVRGTKSNSSGKKYFEVTINILLDTTGYGEGIGICDPLFTSWAGPLGQEAPPGHSSSLLVQPGAQYYVVFQGSASDFYALVPAAGDVISVAVDLTASPSINVYFAVNGTWLNNGSPSSTLTTVDLTMNTGQTAWYPATALAGNSANRSQHTLNAGNAAFAFALPSGYTAWG